MTGVAGTVSPVDAALARLRGTEYMGSDEDLIFAAAGLKRLGGAMRDATEGVIAQLLASKLLRRSNVQTAVTPSLAGRQQIGAATKRLRMQKMQRLARRAAR